jgi:ketosteroid isomerase-like protein
MPADRVTQSRCAILATLHLQAKDDAMSESVIAELEGQLQKAMLASDVDVLDALLADDLTFVDATGKVWSKADDLNAHRYGVQRIERLEIKEQTVRVYDKSAVTLTHASLSGQFGGVPLSGNLRYTRMWVETASGWRIVAAHCSVLAF